MKKIINLTQHNATVSIAFRLSIGISHELMFRGMDPVYAFVSIAFRLSIGISL